jgi:DmsE family decaheme c-type cytochrome
VLVRITQPQKCFTCHAEQRADSYKFSHHPIREGLVVCADCHNPHGSAGPKLLKEFTVNEVCYTCHMEKRGPLLWEHEPVRENCLTCHTPHGSTQARLLVQRPPYLCQDCHANSGHQAQPMAGQNLAGQIAANVRMMARGCVNCHSQIHGSNSPNGTFFTR